MSSLPRHNIQPGELYVSDEPCVITTLLGSCVTVTLYNKHKQFGGMNHFMLPEVIPERQRSDEDFRFGDLSTRHLIKRMLNFDSNREHLEAKLFGGGRVVSALSRANIGQNNVETAKKILAEYGLTPKKEFVEGDKGLKLEFNTETGIVRVKQIRRSKQKVQRIEKKEQTRVADILKSDGDEGIDFIEEN